MLQIQVLKEDIMNEVLTDSQVEFWDNQESVELGSDEIILPNGLVSRNI